MAVGLLALSAGRADRAPRQNAAAATAAPIDAGSIAELRFRYRIEGDTPPWRPLSRLRRRAQGLHRIPARHRPGRDAAAVRHRPGRQGRARQLPHPAETTRSSTGCSPPPNCGSVASASRRSASSAPTGGRGDRRPKTTRAARPIGRSRAETAKRCGFGPSVRASRGCRAKC